eukprot:TRINITY_DN16767_c1_g1_i1.p1 TRINITY_DN16767_c1_g1~~TRINITY_DN16767_c1_g1_i1.p1  ORF type:complete len:215 (+),score=30.42 TRINITY_DN16767_c1_g1_i1:38-682(+)
MAVAMWVYALVISTADVVLESVQFLEDFHIYHGVAFAAQPTLMLFSAGVSAVRQCIVLRKIFKKPDAELGPSEQEPWVTDPTFTVMGIASFCLIVLQLGEVILDVFVGGWLEVATASLTLIFNVILIIYMCRKMKDSEEDNIHSISIVPLKCTPRTYGNSEIYQTCTICLEDFEEGCKVQVMSCGHFFHGSCIEAWWETHSSCPLRCTVKVEEV